MDTHGLFVAEERAFCAAIGRLIQCNHFLPERIQIEREALGVEFIEDARSQWNVDVAGAERPLNVVRLVQRCGELARTARSRLLAGRRGQAEELAAYRDLVHYVIYQDHRQAFRSLATSTRLATSAASSLFRAFVRDSEFYLAPTKMGGLEIGDLAHLFAGICQVERAFAQIFSQILGTSSCVARLRAKVWESIFTANFHRYRQGLHQRMHELTVLISGPSGTGKELVAKAIAESAFIPFDPVKQRFEIEPARLFLPLNLAALSPSLVESELFGHKRGAFTGALQDRLGWFEVCPKHGSVFLDEIGEIDVGLQVKLLRVLQSRSFNRLGESESRLFRGKIIAATNRELVQEIRAGRFREDFYYRICSDIVTTPALREQLVEAPGDLARLAGYIARRLVGEQFAPDLVTEVCEVVRRRLGPDYSWPGNFRELEQCVRGVLIHRDYRPIDLGQTSGNGDGDLSGDILAGRLTADELLRRYCEIIRSQCGSLEEAAGRLGLDRRTVKAKLAPSVRG